MLEHTLATGTVPPGFEAHVGHFLDEAPVNYVVRAAEEVADHRHRKPAEIWSNVAKLAARYAGNRKSLWL
jgi:hypothetical protein